MPLQVVTTLLPRITYTLSCSAHIGFVSHAWPAVCALAGLAGPGPFLRIRGKLALFRTLDPTGNCVVRPTRAHFRTSAANWLCFASSTLGGHSRSFPSVGDKLALFRTIGPRPPLKCQVGSVKSQSWPCPTLTLETSNSKLLPKLALFCAFDPARGSFPIRPTRAHLWARGANWLCFASLLSVTVPAPAKPTRAHSRAGQESCRGTSSRPRPGPARRTLRRPGPGARGPASRSVLCRPPSLLMSPIHRSLFSLAYIIQIIESPVKRNPVFRDRAAGGGDAGAPVADCPRPQDHARKHHRLPQDVPATPGHVLATAYRKTPNRCPSRM